MNLKRKVEGNMINTSDRIRNIVSVIDNDTLVDVGTDHGFISILAVQKGIVKKVVASDVNKGPLNTCQKNIEKYSLQENIEICLSNGLQNVNTKYDSVTICGMGGLLICNILKDDIQKTKEFKQLVLQPQSDYYDVRRLVYELGFYIKEELYLIDNLSKKNTLDKYYLIFNCQKGIKNMPSEKELMLGLNIENTNNEVYIAYITYIYNKSKVAYASLQNAKSSVADKKQYYNKLITYCEEILKDNEIK